MFFHIFMINYCKIDVYLFSVISVLINSLRMFAEVIEKYASRIEALDSDIKDILKQENEEKEVSN